MEHILIDFENVFSQRIRTEIFAWKPHKAVAKLLFWKNVPPDFAATNKFVQLQNTYEKREEMSVWRWFNLIWGKSSEMELSTMGIAANHVWNAYKTKTWHTIETLFEI